MTPHGLLEFFADARCMSAAAKRQRIEAVIHLCDLDSVVHKPIGKLSKGFRQRVGMAQTLLHEPDVLILDEPTAGLDPNQIREVRQGAGSQSYGCREERRLRRKSPRTHRQEQRRGRRDCRRCAHTLCP